MTSSKVRSERFVRDYFGQMHKVDIRSRPTRTAQLSQSIRLVAGSTGQAQARNRPARASEAACEQVSKCSGQRSFATALAGIGLPMDVAVYLTKTQETLAFV